MGELIPQGRRRVVGRKCSRCEAWWLGVDINAPVCLFCSAQGSEVGLLTQGDIDDDRRSEEAIRGDKAEAVKAQARERFWQARSEHDETPPNGREFMSLVSLHAGMSKAVDSLEKSVFGLREQLKRQAAQQNATSQTLLLHKAVVGRLLEAFMSPLKLVDDDSDEEEDDNG